MWKKIWESGIVRDAGIFAGVYVGLSVVKGLKKPVHFSFFDDFPTLQRTVLVQHIAPLEHLNAPLAVRRISRECEEFLQMLSQDLRTKGHEINEKTILIPRLIEKLLKECQGARDGGVAMKAIDFEKDNLGLVRAFLDDSLHNCLLDAQVY